MRVMVARCSGARGDSECGGRLDGDQEPMLRTSPAEVTVLVAHSTTHDNAAGHEAGSPVRLPGGQSVRVVSHEADYDRMRRHASNRTDARGRA